MTTLRNTATVIRWQIPELSEHNVSWIAQLFHRLRISHDKHNAHVLFKTAFLSTQFVQHCPLCTVASHIQSNLSKVNFQQSTFCSWIHFIDRGRFTISCQQEIMSFIFVGMTADTTGLLFLHRVADQTHTLCTWTSDCVPALWSVLQVNSIHLQYPCKSMHHENKMLPRLLPPPQSPASTVPRKRTTVLCIYRSVEKFWTRGSVQDTKKIQKLGSLPLLRHVVHSVWL